jgi:hypothetical protein
MFVPPVNEQIAIMKASAMPWGITLFINDHISLTAGFICLWGKYFPHAHYVSGGDMIEDSTYWRRGACRIEDRRV